jgi:uracil-DNA glycosylase
MNDLPSLLADIRACSICSEHLPLGPNPVIQIHSNAQILIAGQAPGSKVHETGVPFDDPSGKRLRQWMNVTDDIFYDEKQIAILPMGFCYPGTGSSGDLPPRPECVPAWRSQLMDHLPNLELTVVLGQYAQEYHFGKSEATLTELVRTWETYWPDKIPLPHPSPRNNRWLKQNPWFEIEVIPALQKRIGEILAQR